MRETHHNSASVRFTHLQVAVLFPRQLDLDFVLSMQRTIEHGRRLLLAVEREAARSASRGR